MKKAEMEKIIQKLLITTGLVIGVFVAALPFGASAADGLVKVTTTECNAADYQEGNTLQCYTGGFDITVNVKTALRLDAVAGPATIKPTPTSIGTGSISATVTATGIYTLSLSSANPELQHTTYNATIPSVDGVEAGVPGWGVKKGDSSDYSAVTTTPTVFYTSPSGGAATTTNLEVGIGVGAGTPAGDYATSVTVTAALKP